MANPLDGIVSTEIWNRVIDDSTVEKYYNKFGWAKKSMFKDYASSNSIATNLLSDIQDFLYIQDPQFNIITTIWDLVIPLACTLFVLYFLLDITEEISGRVRELDIKFWTTTFIKFAVAVVFFQYGGDIIVGIIDIGNSWISSAINGGTFSLSFAASSLGSGMSDDEQVKYLQALIRTIAEDVGGVEAMIKCILASIVNLVTAIPALFIIVQAITREVTIVLQGGLTPLSFADIYEHGTRSTAFVYIKKFFVALLHGLMMVWVIQICSSLSMSYTYLDGGQKLDLQNWISIAKPILYMFAEVGLIGASKSILNDVFGC